MVAGKRGGDKSKFSKPKKEFLEELLTIDRVTRVNSWGRQLRFRVVVVIGNGKWKVGLGIGKSWEVVDAIAKAIADAKKNLVEVDVSTGTVPYDVVAKFKAAKLMIHPASEGTGIIAGGAARKVLKVAWYRNMLAKKYGSGNPINNARACLRALTSFKK